MKKINMSLKNLTPKSMSCIALGCSAIYETKDNDYVIIGEILKNKAVIAELKNKISSSEVAIKVPKKLLTGLNA